MTNEYKTREFPIKTIREYDIDLQRTHEGYHMIATHGFCRDASLSATLDREGRAVMLNQTGVPEGHELADWNEGDVEEAYRGVML